MAVSRTLLAVSLTAAAIAAADTTAPTVRNWGFGVRRGTTTELRTWALRATDETAAATAVTYTVTVLPTKGELRRLGTAIAVNGTFTQDDIDQRRIAYVHTTSATDAFDRFSFTVSDGTNTTTAAKLEISVGEGLRVQKVGAAKVGAFNADGGVAEIVAFDAATDRLFVVNGATASINILSLSSSGTLSVVGSLRPSLIVAEADDITSVACKNGIVAVAVGNAPVDGVANDAGDRGYLFFYDAATGLYLDHVDFSTQLKKSDGTSATASDVGVQPDMVTFSPDGSKVLVAVEGQPSQDYTVDPQGGVIVVDLSDGVLQARNHATWCGFGSFVVATLRTAGVRIYNNEATPAAAASVTADMEPEYITVSADGATAYVTCQENNALAVVDLSVPQIASVLALGTKDWNTGPQLDPSDEDDGGGDAAVNLVNRPVKGMYMPDAIAYANLAGAGRLLTANEGDAREYTALEEEEKVKDLNLDDTAFPTELSLKLDAQIGELRVSNSGPGTFGGDSDNDGDYDSLYAYGARSFTIWNTDGTRVWDSGDAFEQFLATYFTTTFNVSNDDIELDSRSPKKGPEPEGLTVLDVGGTAHAVIGLERQGGFFLYNISTPTAPTMTAYYTGRHLDLDPDDSDEAELAGDLAPEGILAISSSDSPTGKPLVVLGNEVSGTIAVHEVVLAASDTYSGSGTGMGGETSGGSSSTASADDDDGSGCGVGGSGIILLTGMLAFLGLRRRRD